MKALIATLLRPLRQAAMAGLALLLVFEEWGWEPLQRLLARVAHLPVMRQIEAGVQRLPPWAALAVFLLPTALLLPVKLAALWLVAQGHGLAGVALIVLAKLVGTAIVARLFVLTRPALLQMPWFARLYGRWVPWKEALLTRVRARLRASWVWRASRWVKRGLKRRWSRWTGR